MEHGRTGFLCTEEADITARLADVITERFSSDVARRIHGRWSRSGPP